MTDILLINPPLTMDEKFGAYLKSGGSKNAPVGLCYLASYIKQKGFIVKILDCDALELNTNQIINIIIKEDPKYIGFTSSTLSIYNVNNIIKLLKKEGNKSKIILGGSHITAAPKKTMEIFSDIDVGVIGEGEITFGELLDSFEKNKSIENIKGIIYRDGKSIKLTNQREPIKDLDILPKPAYDLLPYLPKYYRPPLFSVNKLPSIPMITSRGCPNNCIFCDNTVFGRHFRAHSAEYIIDLIKDVIKRYKIKDVFFDDDAFPLDRNRIIKFCNLLIKEKINISWSCNSRIGILKPDILKLMKKAGCWQISYGIESGNQEILNFINKNITIDQIKQTLKWTKEAGIRSKGYFMIGHPNETIKTIEDTIKLACDSDLNDFMMSFVTPFPNTYLEKIANKYGTFDHDWKKTSIFKVSFIPNNFTEESLIKWHKYATQKFYLRPKIIFGYIKMLKNPLTFLKLLKGAQVILMINFYKRNA